MTTTTQTNLQAAFILLDAITVYIEQQPYSSAKKRFLRSDGIATIASTLNAYAGRIEYLQRENDRLTRLLAGAYEKGLEIGGSSDHALVAAIREMLAEVAA